jgi:hypothetical protein
MPVSEKYLPGRTVNGQWQVHSRVAALIQGHESQILRFHQLPAPARLALIQHMAVDGEAWSQTGGLSEAIHTHLCSRSNDEQATKQWEKTLSRFLPHYTKRYAHEIFGYLPALPIAALTACILKDADFQGNYQRWDKYHQWYSTFPLKHAATGPEPWPVILSGFADETLEDGWERLHRYYQQGRETVPALFYPRSMPHLKLFDSTTNLPGGRTMVVKCSLHGGGLEPGGPEPIVWVQLQCDGYNPRQGDRWVSWSGDLLWDTTSGLPKRIGARDPRRLLTALEVAELEQHIRGKLQQWAELQ